MKIPIAIEPGDDATAFGVVVPDLPGCFSAGDTLDDACANAVEAIELWLETALENQELVPLPTSASLAQHQRDPELAGWLWGFVDIDFSKLDEKGDPVSIKLPRQVLRAVDLCAEQQGETRNGFLIRAALNQLQHEMAAPNPT